MGLLIGEEKEEILFDEISEIENPILKTIFVIKSNVYVDK